MKKLLILLLAVASLDAATLRTVCASGCTYSLARLQDAINDAKTADAGDVVEIKEGETATGGLAVPVRGTDTSLIVIRSSGCGQIPGDVRVSPTNSHLAHINAPVTFAADPNYPGYSAATYYRFECIDFPNPGSVAAYPVFMDLLIGTATGAAGMKPDFWPHDITFDRCVLNMPDSVTAKNLIFMAGSRLTFTNSVFYGAKDGINETHSLAGINVGGFLVFRNNQMSSESMNILLGGAAPVARGQHASDVTFIGNYLYKPWKMRVRIKTTAASGSCLIDPDGNGEWWKDTVLVTYKQCQGTPGDATGTWQTVTAGTFNAATQYFGFMKDSGEYKYLYRCDTRGNVIQNSWNDPAFAGQHGSAWENNQVDGTVGEFRDNVIDCTFVNNKMIDVPWGFANGVIAGSTPYPSNMHNRFIKTLIVNLGNPLFTTGDDALAVQVTKMGQAGAYPMEFRNMTISSGATTVGRMISIDIPAVNVVFNNSIGDAMQCAVLDSSAGGGCLWNGITLAWPQPRSFSKNVISQNQTCTSFFTWPCITFDLFYNADTPSASDQVGGRNNRHPLYMANNSWYDTAAIGFTDAANGDFSLQTTSPFYHWGLHGSNPGIDQAELDSVTAAVPTGAANPNLDFLIRSIIPGTGSAVVNYSTPTTATATLTFSRFGDATSGTVVTSTDSGGSVDRTATVSLDPGRWFMKITSGGVTTTPVDSFWVH